MYKKLTFLTTFLINRPHTNEHIKLPSMLIKVPKTTKICTKVKQTKTKVTILRNSEIIPPLRIILQLKSADININ